MVRLFQNLVGNAIKYRGDVSPVVKIIGKEIEGGWQIAATDNGGGIDPSDQDRLFKLFKRGTDKIPGSGIGLAICKRIVERHGGRIWLESRLGQGATFHLTLMQRKEQHGPFSARA